jgi:CheY-like chemotaxis protein
MSVASKVLIMDDEEVMREMLSMMLSASGYTVVLAEDGQEAIARFTEANESGEPFDAVILDLNIRCGMGGKEAITKLLEVDPCAKVILLSGYHCDPVMKNYHDYGFSAALPKPYRLEELQSVLQRIIRGRKTS